MLCQTISSQTKLESLKLNESDFTRDQTQQLIQTLAHCCESTLQILELDSSANFGSNEACANLIRLITANTLKVIKIRCQKGNRKIEVKIDLLQEEEGQECEGYT